MGIFILWNHRWNQRQNIRLSLERSTQNCSTLECARLHVVSHVAVDGCKLNRGDPRIPHTQGPGPCNWQIHRMLRWLKSNVNPTNGILMAPSEFQTFRAKTCSFSGSEISRKVASKCVKYHKKRLPSPWVPRRLSDMGIDRYLSTGDGAELAVPAPLNWGIDCIPTMRTWVHQISDPWTTW